MEYIKFFFIHFVCQRMNSLSVSTVCNNMNRMRLLRSCLNGLEKPYDLMVFLRTVGDAKKARHHLMIHAITRKTSTSICTNFLSLSTVGEIIFYFEMNRIWLLPCP